MRGSSAAPMIRGPALWAARAGIAARALHIARRGRSPLASVRVLGELLGQVGRRRGFPLPPRRVRVGGRTFVDLTIPGWPSPSFDRFVEGELERIAPTRAAPPPLQLAVLAVTRLCPLRCEHCSEGDAVAQDDALSVGEVVEVARGVAALGASHLELSGGEPMSRPEAVEAVCRALAPGVDVWVLTSGVGLDERSASRLRAAGAVGVAVSLDHWDAARHDAFRGRTGAFESAVAGVRAARSAGLVPALSLTVTRAFANVEDLGRYARLGGELGAGFLRMLEPRAVGRWSGRDVALLPEQVDLLLRFAREVNESASALPLVELPASSQRTVGCFGSGDRYLFVDADGFVHACPFCRGRAGSARGGSLAETRALLRSRGCHAFPAAHPDRPGSLRGDRLRVLPQVPGAGASQVQRPARAPNLEIQDGPSSGASEP